MAAVAMAVATWSRDLEGARLRVFIENTAAEAVLVKGRGKRVAGGACDRGASQISQACDQNAIVRNIWLAFLKLGVTVWAERVAPAEISLMTLRGKRTNPWK